MQLTKRAYEVVAEELHRNIEANILKPGDKLDTIERLAKQYQVGRSTIREALGLLKAQGLVESVQGGGTYVTKNPVQDFSHTSSEWLISTEELRQLLQVRKILEVGTISLAVEYRTTDNLEKLRRIVDQMRNSIGNEEISQLHDVNFHLAIARASHNDLLEKMMEGLSSTMTQTIRQTRKLWLYHELQSASHLFEEHEKMFVAIETKNIALAVDAMRQHLDRVEVAFDTIDHFAK